AVKDRSSPGILPAFRFARCTARSVLPSAAPAPRPESDRAPPSALLLQTALVPPSAPRPGTVRALPTTPRPGSAPALLSAPCPGTAPTPLQNCRRRCRFDPAP